MPMYPSARPNQALQLPIAFDDRRTVVFTGAAVMDAAGCFAAPGAVAIAGGRVVAAGQVEATITAAGPAIRIEQPGRLLLPGLVNAHAHLDLTAVGKQPYEGDFIGWIMMLRRHLPDPTDVTSRINQRWRWRSARRGARRSLRAGVVTVGDISRDDAVRIGVGEAGLRGVGYRELFGLGEPFHTIPPERLGRTVEEAEASTDPPSPMTPGLQPHAPYSAGRDLFRAAADTGRPVCTHLAELPEEAEFVTEASGPFRDLLMALGKWRDQFADQYRDPGGPVAWLGPFIRDARWLCAHCNYVRDDDIATLARGHASVAYCPRASAYFGHTDHRYRDMLDAGVNVCLGTDSIVCHGSLSIVDEMRFLHQRDQTDPTALLRMATMHGMEALRMPAKHATFALGASPGVISVLGDADTQDDPLKGILAARRSPKIALLALPRPTIES